MTDLDVPDVLWGDTPRLCGENGVWFNACPLMAWTAIRMLLWLCDIEIQEAP